MSGQITTTLAPTTMPPGTTTTPMTTLAPITLSTPPPTGQITTTLAPGTTAAPTTMPPGTTAPVITLAPMTLSPPPPPTGQITTTLAPTTLAPTADPVPIALTTTVESLPEPSGRPSAAPWTDDIKLTTQPPATQNPSMFSDKPWTQTPQPEWHETAYAIVDAEHYGYTGELRALTVIGRDVLLSTFRENDKSQLWVMSTLGYVRNVGTNAFLSHDGDCSDPSMTTSLANGILWEFRGSGREKEMYVVSQCGSRLKASEFGDDVKMDYLGGRWFVVPVGNLTV